MGGREGGSNAPKKASPRLQECTTAKETQRPFFFFLQGEQKNKTFLFFFCFLFSSSVGSTFNDEDFLPFGPKSSACLKFANPLLFCSVLFCSVLWPGLSSVASLWHSCLFGLGLQGLQHHPDMQGSRSGGGWRGKDLSFCSTATNTFTHQHLNCLGHPCIRLFGSLTGQLVTLDGCKDVSNTRANNIVSLNHGRLFVFL